MLFNFQDSSTKQEKKISGQYEYTLLEVARREIGKQTQEHLLSYVNFICLAAPDSLRQVPVSQISNILVRIQLELWRRIASQLIKLKVILG